MDFDKQHRVWVEQVAKLIASNDRLQETDSRNIMCHFFTQVIERDFCHELEPTKQSIKNVVRAAIDAAPRLSGSCRQRAAAVFAKALPLEEPMLAHIRLNDIRNLIVFELFKRCGVTLDTYFERYSSPPGTDGQNEMYLAIAHGKAVCTATWTQKLSLVVNTMQILKTVFLVYDIFTGAPVEVNSTVLNWHGAKWMMHTKQSGLGDLVWNVFLDVWECEHSVYK